MRIEQSIHTLMRHFLFIKQSKLFLLLLSASLLIACQQPVESGLDKSEAARKHLIAAKAYLEEGDTRKALKHLKKAESFERKSVDLFQTYALLYRVENDPKREEHYYRKALSQDRNDSRTKNNYGSFLCFHDEAKKGIKLLVDASEDYQYQGRAEAYVNRGLCEQVLEDEAAAEKSFQQAIRLSTRSNRPYIELAEIYFHKNDLRLASMYHQQYMDRQTQQEARALIVGIRIAHKQGDQNRLSSYGLLLERLYPQSEEHKEYINLTQ